MSWATDSSNGNGQQLHRAGGLLLEGCEVSRVVLQLTLQRNVPVNSVEIHRLSWDSTTTNGNNHLFRNKVYSYLDLLKTFEKIKDWFIMCLIQGGKQKDHLEATQKY